MTAAMAAVTLPPCSRRAAMFEIVQGRGADRQPLLVACIPFGHARVEIPAVVVETRRLGEVPDLLEAAVLQLAEADDDVGHLDAGVVDVVLHFDRRAAERERAHERVAERRVAQVADVRRLVRVDRRVLDDGLVGLAVWPAPAGAMSPRKPRDQKRRPVEKHVQVAVRRGVDARHAGKSPRRPAPAAERSRAAAS